MELVKVIAVKSFVSPVVGSVTKKQVLNIRPNLAEEFVAMGLVEYPAAKKPNEAIDPKKSSSSPTSGEDGKEQLSASSPVETASSKTKSTTPKAKTGK